MSLRTFTNQDFKLEVAQAESETDSEIMEEDQEEMGGEEQGSA